MSQPQAYVPWLVTAVCSLGDGSYMIKIFTKVKNNNSIWSKQQQQVKKRESFTGTRRKASSISSLVRPFLSRKDLLCITGDPRTLGWERNLMAFWIWSSRKGSEFLKTEGGESCCLGVSWAMLACWASVVGGGGGEGVVTTSVNNQHIIRLTNDT